jgi:undecaprenyl-diphosphatase
MTLLDAVILGILQGASEFLPISSSAHLVIGQALLGVSADNIYLEVALHFGTLLSVVVFFFKDIVELTRSFVRFTLGDRTDATRSGFMLATYIIIGTIPAAIGGLLLKDWFEARFDSAQFSGFMLLITSAALLSTFYLKKFENALSVGSALLIGFAQMLAILPGISRSGATITAGLYLGLKPEFAARFSFLLSLPAVAGAALLKGLELAEHPIADSQMAIFGLGAVVSFFVGLVAIYWLLRIVVGRRFYLFGFYCLVVGILTILFL